jgi:hypothetical protein
MFNVDKAIGFMKSPQGKIFISILWGFALASIVKFTCKSRDCLIYTAPDKTDVKGRTHRFNGKCYVFDMVDAECER